MERLERLVNLVAALLEAEQPLSRDDLRVRVGGYSDDADAFRRNFERDKDLLRQMGMPLVLEPLAGSEIEGAMGYRIPRDRYQLPDPGLTDDELAALHLAVSAVDIAGAWGRSAATTALWKLAAAGAAEAPAAEAMKKEAQPPKVALNLPAGEQVAALFGAVAARQRVEFSYHGTTRQVDPWRLSFRNGQWYLAGFDHSRAGSRTFRLDRLETVPAAVGPPGAFERPPAASNGPAPAWQLGIDEETTAVLAVDAGHAAFAVTAAGPATRIEHRSDGSVVLTVTVTNRDAFLSFVLGFLDHAELLGPPGLVAELLDRLAGLAEVAG